MVARRLHSTKLILSILKETVESFIRDLILSVLWRHFSLEEVTRFKYERIIKLG